MRRPAFSVNLHLPRQYPTRATRLVLLSLTSDSESDLGERRGVRVRARVHDLRDGHALPPRLFLRGNSVRLSPDLAGEFATLTTGAARTTASPPPAPAASAARSTSKSKPSTPSVDAFARLRRRERGEHHRRRDRRDRRRPRPAPARRPACETHPGFRLVLGARRQPSRHAWALARVGAAGASGTGDPPLPRRHHGQAASGRAKRERPSSFLLFPRRGSGSTLETRRGFDETRARARGRPHLGFINPSRDLASRAREASASRVASLSDVGVFTRALADRGFRRGVAA